MATDLLASEVVFDPDADLTAVDIDDQMTLDNVIVDTSTGQVRFVVLNSFVADQERLIAVPLNQFRWDAERNVFVYTGDPAMLQDAPFFENGYTGAFEEGWETEYNNFWQ